MKKKPEYSRVLGRQVAVDLPEEDLSKIFGRTGVGVQGTRTCDGNLTVGPRGKDCNGGAGWDDDAYEY